ncbi:DUF2309 domain-containing protein [Marinobacteraceae bacterium S3BR75-40.1]
MKTAAELVALAESGRTAAQAMLQATDQIAPNWPLDRSIAVNPWWPQRQQTFETVSLQLHERCGALPLMSASHYHERYQSGAITDADLTRALEEAGSPFSEVEAHRVLAETGVETGGLLPLWSRAWDEQEGLLPGERLTDRIRNQVSQVCGRFFDGRQSGWPQSGEAGLLSEWLQQMRLGRDLKRITGSDRARPLLDELPETPEELLALGCRWLGIDKEQAGAVGHALLLEINGWASYCAWRGWEAALKERDDDTLKALLAVRLAWEVLIWGSRPAQAWVALLEPEWQRLREQRAMREKQIRYLWVWQRALEWGYQRRLIQDLAAAPYTPSSDMPDVQAAFCIDVRSEVIRRALEAQSSGIRTLGFAGFFGIPMGYRALDSQETVPQLPGLLAPAFQVHETTGDLRQDLGQRAERLRQVTAKGVLKRLKQHALSTFPMVEGLGMLSGWALVRDSLGLKPATDPAPKTRDGALCHAYSGDPLQPAEKVDLAESILRGLSLPTPWAPLVLLVGHGSYGDNNPHQAGLACGACGGQNGGINAAVAARLLNDREVRGGLLERGVSLPGHVWFQAAEHNTVTDSITLIMTEAAPESHRHRLQQLEEWLERASARCRRERAARLGLGGSDDQALRDALERRTRNWSEVRPEWGLANNAALVIGPRSRTRALNLEGRVFLHEYRADSDPDGQVLEGLMTAPMVVTNWINLQYYASVTEPGFYGAGSKLLHSVVGGNIGVLEGHTGDLRIGLPIQSVHDGKDWVHEPLRLSVFIDAPQERIDAILQRQPDVRALVEGQWLFLFCIEQGQPVQVHRQGAWETVDVA